MTVFIAQDEAGYLKKIAQLFLESMVTAIQERGRFTVAVSGGNTPKKVFALLADDYYRSRIQWDLVYFFWVDERCVPPQHVDSNYAMTNQILLSKVPIPQDHVFRMPGETQPPRDAAKAYENTMKAFFKLDKSFPRLDLVLLGLGEDGHIASLFPQTEALKETERWVVANHVLAQPSDRITLTFPVLNNAARILFLCSGNSKTSIVREVFRDDISLTRYPAQMIKPTQGELFWLLDAPSAAKLPSAIRFGATHV